MSQLISAPAVYTDFSGLDRLRLEAREQSPDALGEAARQFEALFIQMMLKNMRAASFGDELFGSDQQRQYQAMFDQQMSLHLGGRGGLGIADLLVRQLGDRDGAAEDGGGQMRDTAAVSINGAIAAPRSSSGSHRALFESPQEFVRTLRPHAAAAAERLGVAPEVLLAQAALETGWGRQVIHRSDGSPSHNLFGIKAGPQWSGERVMAATLEFDNGVAVRRRESFRAYDSFAESFADYTDYIEANPRYQAARDHSGDARRYLTGLEQGGYATDPLYAGKIDELLNSKWLSGAT